MEKGGILIGKVGAKIYLFQRYGHPNVNKMKTKLFTKIQIPEKYHFYITIFIQFLSCVFAIYVWDMLLFAILRLFWKFVFYFILAFLGYEVYNHRNELEPSNLKFWKKFVFNSISDVSNEIVGFYNGCIHGYNWMCKNDKTFNPNVRAMSQDVTKIIPTLPKKDSFKKNKSLSKKMEKVEEKTAVTSHERTK
jgi:hypothetical protein